jgi:hypothetical protein
MNFFTKATSKVNINLTKMRNYYKEKMIKNLPDILAQENNLVDIAKLETVLDALFLSNDDIRFVFTKRIN